MYFFLEGKSRFLYEIVMKKIDGSLLFVGRSGGFCLLLLTSCTVIMIPTRIWYLNMNMHTENDDQVECKVYFTRLHTKYCQTLTLTN